MDEIIRAVSKDGFVKISVVTARDAVQRANAIHHCSPTAIAALGRSLCAASMLGVAYSKATYEPTVAREKAKS